MIGEIDWFGRIVGGAGDGEISANARIAKALIRAGLAVVIIEPGGKKAVCTLNSRDKKAADIEAQDAARAAGSPNWERVRHECGIKHAITEEKYLTRARVKALLNEGANLAVALGRGERRILIVDVDTAEERRAFLTDWQTSEGLPYEHVEMTVSSPGVITAQVDGNDVWTHKDGGHFWFDLPDDVELPERPGKLTWCRCHGVQQPAGGCRNAWSAYYASGYVLVPPSVRPEGAYRLTGAVHVAPEWLTTLIRESRANPERPDGSGALSRFEDDPIDVWSARTSWSDILTADDFRPHDHDTCGCPTFTRPGDATHSKSVTGHEVGCTQYDTSKGHGPLRIWSDALGSGTLSKLSYMAKFHHGGNMGEAMSALGLSAMSEYADVEGFGIDDLDAEAEDGELSAFADGDDSPKGQAPEQGADSDPFAPIDWFELFEEGEQFAEFLPARLLERGQQIALVGDGKSGKSLLMAEWCIRAISGRQFMTEDVDCEPITILYLDAENSRRDILSRSRSLGAGPSDLFPRLVYLSFPPFKPLDSDDGAKQVMALVKKHRPDVVILDTVSRFVQGKENDSDTWLALYRLLHRRMKRLGVACIRLDHFGKDNDRGARGNSAKSQDIDHVWELSVTEEAEEPQGNVIEVVTMLDLHRTHTRTGLGPDRIRIRRRGLKYGNQRGWLPDSTAHELADVFDGARTGLGSLPDEPERPESVMVAVSDYLSENNTGIPLRTIREDVRGQLSVRATLIDDAIRILREEGYVNVVKQGRANLHYPIKPYTGTDIGNP